MTVNEYSGRFWSGILTNGLTSIKKEVFEECYGLKDILLPDGVEEIENYAFKNCRNLGNINLPDTITMLGTGVFWG